MIEKVPFSPLLGPQNVSFLTQKTVKMADLPVFSGQFCMGWAKIPILMCDFPMPCIYGDGLSFENGPRNRAHAIRVKIGQKRARTTRSEGRIYVFFSAKTVSKPHCFEP